MKIFLAYGYNQRDRWVLDLVKPLIEAFGAECITGDQEYGQAIPQGVQDKIKSADGLIGVLTRRNDSANTHLWVVSEIAYARSNRQRAIVVREIGVDPQTIPDTGQAIVYDPAARDRCILEIAQALGQLTATRGQLQLLPYDIREDVRRALRNGEGILCEVTVRAGSDEYKYTLDANKLITLAGGPVAMNYSDVPRDALVKLDLRCNGKRWISDYHGMGLRWIYLEQE